MGEPVIKATNISSLKKFFIGMRADITVDMNVVGNSELSEYMKRVVKSEAPAFIYNDSVTGFFHVENTSGKPIQHKCVKVSLIGRFRTAAGREVERFFVNEAVIAGAGVLGVGQALDDVFEFENVEFPMSSYDGCEISAEYLVEFRIVRGFKDFVMERKIMVLDFQTFENGRCTFELGIRGLLHVEFIFTKKYVDTQDVVIGRICFLNAKLRIVQMSIVLCCKETFKAGGVSVEKERELKVCEVLDGTVVRGDSIPVRFFLGDADICPFTAPEGCKLQVHYFLMARLADETGKKYYKPMKLNIIRDGSEFAAGRY